MTSPVISYFAIQAQAKTREECAQRLDDASMAMLNDIGGAPWEMVDDDIKRIHCPGSIMSDDQGYAYQGDRSYRFKGPAMGLPGRPLHDAYQVQKGVE